MKKECDFCHGLLNTDAYLELINHKTKSFAWFCSPECLYHDVEDHLDGDDLSPTVT